MGMQMQPQSAAMQFGGGESSEDEDCMLSENFKLFITNMDIERKDPSAEEKSWEGKILY